MARIALSADLKAAIKHLKDIENKIAKQRLFAGSENIGMLEALQKKAKLKVIQLTHKEF